MVKIGCPGRLSGAESPTKGADRGASGTRGIGPDCYSRSLTRPEERPSTACDETARVLARGAERRGGGVWGGVSPPHEGRWRGSQSDPRQQPVAQPARRSTCDASRLNRASMRRSSLRFGRNTPGTMASRALSAGRIAPSCCENAAWLSNGSRTGQDRRSVLERRVPELRGMDAGWRRLPSLVLKGSPQSYRSAPETAGTAVAGRERNHARRLNSLWQNPRGVRRAIHPA